MDDLPPYDDLIALLPTDRDLRFRAWTAADAPAVLAALDDRARRWMAPIAHVGLAEATDYATGAAAGWARRRHLRLCVTEASGTVLGALDLDGVGEGTGELSGEAELGWWVSPAARGRGVGVRAGRLGVDVALRLLRARRVWAAISAENQASRWVAAAAGLHLEATLRGAEPVHGGDSERWRLLAGEEPLAPQPELSAGRLHLLPPRPRDAAAITAACQGPEIPRWTTVPSPYTESDGHGYVGMSLGAWAGNRGGNWLVLDSVTGDLLGAVGLTRLTTRTAEVGFWAAAEARGRGAIPDAVRAVCRWAFGTGWCEVVEWRALVGNAPSVRVAEKCGFTMEGTLRRRLRADADTLVGSLLPGELR